MDFSAARAKLKKTVVKDSSAPVLEEGIQPLEKNSYEHTILDFNIERWLDLLGDATFPTQFLPISVDDARLFMRAYERLEAKQPIVEEDQKRLDAIASALDAVIARVKGDNASGVFIKTSSRSAKNSSTGSAELVEQYKRFRAADDSKERDSDNNKIMALLRAGTAMLQIRNAAEAVSIFCRSERIYNDFDIALRHTDRFVENFVVRKWVPLEVTLEFRCFVVNGRLTAITQYSNLVHLPHVVANRERILSVLMAFFEAHVREQLQPRTIEESASAADAKAGNNNSANSARDKRAAAQEARRDALKKLIAEKRNKLEELRAKRAGTLPAPAPPAPPPPRVDLDAAADSNAAAAEETSVDENSNSGNSGESKQSSKRVGYERYVVDLGFPAHALALLTSKPAATAPAASSSAATAAETTVNTNNSAAISANSDPKLALEIAKVSKMQEVVSSMLAKVDEQEKEVTARMEALSEMAASLPTDDPIAVEKRNHMELVFALSPLPCISLCAQLKTKLQQKKEELLALRQKHDALMRQFHTSPAPPAPPAPRVEDRPAGTASAADSDRVSNSNNSADRGDSKQSQSESQTKLEPLPRPFVIEINPFLPTTDSGLFCWAKDKRILHGEAPFEFRLRTEPVRGALAGLLPDWRQVIETVDASS